MRLTFVLVVLAMAMQGLFLLGSLVLPLWLHDSPALAAAELRRHWWQTSGFAPLMIGVLLVLPVLAAQSPKLSATGWLRRGTASYALAILGQALMLLVLSRETQAEASDFALWWPGVAAFGLWLLTLSLIVVARRQATAPG